MKLPLPVLCVNMCKRFTQSMWHINIQISGISGSFEYKGHRGHLASLTLNIKNTYGMFKDAKKTQIGAMKANQRDE